MPQELRFESYERLLDDLRSSCEDVISWLIQYEPMILQRADDLPEVNEPEEEQFFIIRVDNDGFLRIHAMNKEGVREDLEFWNKQPKACRYLAVPDGTLLQKHPAARLLIKGRVIMPREVPTWELDA